MAFYMGYTISLVNVDYYGSQLVFFYNSPDNYDSFTISIQGYILTNGRAAGATVRSNCEGHVRSSKHKDLLRATQAPEVPHASLAYYKTPVHLIGKINTRGQDLY